jgi:hypothetical protein
MHGCVECDDVSFVLRSLATASGRERATLVDLGANIGPQSPR